MWKYGLCFSLFNTGKIVVTGNATVTQATKALELVLSERSPDAKIRDFSVRNMFYTGKLLIKVPWEEVRSLPCLVHEPELFPAAYWRKGKGLIALFHTGSYNLMGLKSHESAHDLLKCFLKDIEKIL